MSKLADVVPQKRLMKKDMQSIPSIMFHSVDDTGSTGGNARGGKSTKTFTDYQTVEVKPKDRSDFDFWNGR